MLFRIRKGTHVSHFQTRCPLWPQENYYEQPNPLWWGTLCVECLKIADREEGIRGQGRNSFSRT